MNRKLKKILLISAASLLGLLIIAELILRFGLDLGERPLYHADPHCEYYFKPNQKISRHGNTFATDACGCRNKKIKDTAQNIILKLGDSVINGGSHVDQDSTATYRLNRLLKAKNTVTTNCSAGSWGVENAYQFMLHRINYKADAIVLIFSAHDWHDNMNFHFTIGEHFAKPNAQPMTAISDVWNNYLWPKIQRNIFGVNNFNVPGFKDTAVNKGWQHFVDYSEKRALPLLVYVHPDRTEFKSKTWSQEGKELIHWLEIGDVNFITGMNDQNSLTHYRDPIHFNKKGHQFLAAQLRPKILDMLKGSD